MCASFDVEVVGDSPGDIQNRLTEIDTSVRRRTNNALRKTAEEVKEDLVESSPVDDGVYQRSWYIQPISYNEIWILNEADHAQYVMLPNTQMINATGADFPAQGILHGVKSRARQHSDSYRQNMVQELQDMIQNFRVD